MTYRSVFRNAARLGSAFAFVLLVAGCGRNQGSSQASGENATQAISAPPFSLADLSGKNISLDSFKGQVVMLDFWATWCPPCRESIPVLQELYRDYAKKGFTVVGVSLDQDPSAVAPFAREKNLTYPILLAGESNVSELYGVRGIPTIYLLNKEGQIVDRWIGYDSSYRDEWRGSIDKLLLNS